MSARRSRTTSVSKTDGQIADVDRDRSNNEAQTAPALHHGSGCRNKLAVHPPNSIDRKQCVVILTLHDNCGLITAYEDCSEPRLTWNEDDNHLKGVSMISRDLAVTLESGSIQLAVNWFLGQCYTTYLTTGSFFKALLTKQYSIEQIRRFGQGFAVYRCKYPRLLGVDVILSNFEREEWKSSAYHLLEELGGANGTQTHGELFAEFLRELDLVVEPGFVVCRVEELEFVNTFYDQFEQYLREKTEVERRTILAIFELVDNADYSSLYSGLSQYGFSEHSMTFFKIHAEAMHWANCKSEIETLWSCKENRSKIVESFDFLLKLQQDLYEGMHNWITGEISQHERIEQTVHRRMLDVSASVEM